MDKKNITRCVQIIPTALKFFALFFCMIFFGFEIYVVAVGNEGSLPLPTMFGNFPRVRDILEKSPQKEEFSFAVVGDTLGMGTFDKISERFRALPLDFAVLLGDCALKGTEFHQRFFRAECSEELAQAFPLFYLAGNHDVSIDHFPVSRFEEFYGPTIFSFDYQGCQFIMLRILDPPFNNKDSIAFLNHLKNQTKKYRHKFVFMHIPPPISDSFVARHYAEWKELISLIKELKIDTVFAGDFHGYARVQSEGINYIITGGGGSRLHDYKVNFPQFYHAVVITVDQDRISERILQIPDHFEPEDFIEKIAIVNVYPWMTQHGPALTGLNILCLSLLALTLHAFIRSRPHRIRRGE